MMRNLSIRLRILLLIMLSVLPGLGLTVYNAVTVRAQAQTELRENLQRLAKLSALQQEQFIHGLRQMLAGSSRHLATLWSDKALCSEYFRSLNDISPGLYKNMGAFDTTGELRCGVMPWQGKVSALEKRYFKLALASGKFSIGDYQIGVVTKAQSVNFGYPVFDPVGKLVAVSFVALDMTNFSHIAAEVPLPAQGRIAIFDRNGIILAQHPESAGDVGRKVDDIVHAASVSNRRGILKSTDTKGNTQLVAYESVSANPDNSVPLFVAVAVPLNAVYANANETFVQSLVGIALATLLLLAIGWYGTERFVLRNIKLLLDAAKRMHAGNLGTRTGLIHAGEELNQLGRTFDEMALALQQRDAELRLALHDMQEQAITDSLTGLFNRRHLLQILPAELKRAQRNGSQLAVVMLDLDHFKRINDTFGHDAGDSVLKALGALLRSGLRGSDLAFRVGGEEFVLVLPETSLEGARLKAEKIRAAIGLLDLRSQGRPLGHLSASLGVAPAPLFPDHDRLDLLLRTLDQALYKAKGMGRDCVVVSTANPPTAAEPS